MENLDPRVYNLFPSSWIKGRYNVAKYDLTYSYSVDGNEYEYKTLDRVLLEFKCTLRYKSLYKLFFSTEYTSRSSSSYLESMGYIDGENFMPTIKGLALLFLLEKGIHVSYDTLRPSYVNEWCMILIQEAFSKFYRNEYYEIDKFYIQPKNI